METSRIEMKWTWNTNEIWKFNITVPVQLANDTENMPTPRRHYEDEKNT